MTLKDLMQASANPQRIPKSGIDFQRASWVLQLCADQIQTMMVRYADTLPTLLTAGSVSSLIDKCKASLELNPVCSYMVEQVNLPKNSIHIRIQYGKYHKDMLYARRSEKTK
jgi:hypothetical protein